MEETPEKSEVFFMSDDLIGIFDPSDLSETKKDSEKIFEAPNLQFVSYAKKESHITVCASKKFVKDTLMSSGQSFKKKFFGLEFEMTNEFLEISAAADPTEFLVTLKVVQIREV